MITDTNRQPFPFAYKPGDRVTYIARPAANYSKNYAVPAVVVAVVGKTFRVQGVRYGLEGLERFEANTTHDNLSWRHKPCRALGEPHPRYDDARVTIYNDFTGEAEMTFDCYTDYEAALVWANTTAIPVGETRCEAMMRYAATYRADAAASMAAATITNDGDQS